MVELESVTESVLIPMLWYSAFSKVQVINVIDSDGVCDGTCFHLKLCKSVFSKASGLYDLICCFCRLIKLSSIQIVTMYKITSVLIEIYMLGK